MSSQQEESTKIKRELVDALDLYPILQNVAKHAGTKRAIDAFMQLVTHEDDSQKKNEFYANYNNSKKKASLSSMAGGSTFSSSVLGKDSRSLYSSKFIIKIARNIEEAQREWDLIKEASDVLGGHYKASGTRNRSSLKSQYKKTVPIPPLYGSSSSPWSVSIEDTNSDDDEWLRSILNGFTGTLELENILQAEQVVKRIIGCKRWADDEQVQKVAPNLSLIFKEIYDFGGLQNIYNEIEETVRIVKGSQTFSGMQTFAFELNSAKFPNLSILKQKEKALMDQTNKIMEKLFSNKKYVSQLSGFTRKKPEPYELEGRIVVAAPREVAQKIGIIRSQTDSFCYVEPQEIVKIGNEIQSIRKEIEALSNEITQHLSGTVIRGANSINHGLDVVAKLDSVIARAAFGFTLNGYLPIIQDEGRIQIKDFIHPVLATKSRSRVVPVDLCIGDENGKNTLVISGVNGGGKSLAMKSFGVCAMLTKLGIPLPRDDSSYNMNDVTRCDFFDEILVEVGDHQSLEQGESTYMAQLNSLSKVLQKIEESSKLSSSLILLDELGSGTDPTQAACIAQAFLEKILENRRTRTIVTTHSTQLKALSLEDNRFESASVLLQVGSDDTQYRLPSYKLVYGTVGNSYALSAAARASPKIPDDVLDRAAALIASSQDKSASYLRTITEAMEAEKDRYEEATVAVESYRKDIILCRDALVTLSKSYESQLSKVETKLDNMLIAMKESGKDNFDVIGDSLSMLRLVKKAIKSKEDMLREKGMKIVTISDVLQPRSSVTIINGDFEGDVGFVSDNQNDVGFDEVAIDLDMEYGLALGTPKLRLTLKRSDLAIFYYPSMDEDWGSYSDYTVEKTVIDSRNSLLNTLNSLKTEEKMPKKNSPVPAKKKSGPKSKFTSSRQRKAANKTASSKKKR